jgi:hypothetical protein
MRKMAGKVIFPLLLLAIILPLALAGESFPAVPVASFSTPNLFYHNWKIKKWKGTVSLDFGRREGMPFLRMFAPDSSWAFIRRFKVNLNRTPELTWSWEASVLPKGGDGRHRNTDDEAAQVYVLFAGSRWLGGLDARILGYTWETVPGKGTVYTSPKNSNCRIIVLRNENDPLHTWFTERRNVLKDFQTAFKTKDTPDPIAVSFQIDSDDTRSVAESSIARITFQPAG